MQLYISCKYILHTAVVLHTPPLSNMVNVLSMYVYEHYQPLAVPSYTDLNMQNMQKEEEEKGCLSATSKYKYVKYELQQNDLHEAKVNGYRKLSSVD